MPTRKDKGRRDVGMGGQEWECGRVNPKAGVSVIQYVEGTESQYKVVKNLQ